MADKTTQIQTRLARAERHVAELEALYRISQILSGKPRQRRMLVEVLNILDSELGMSRGAIVLVSPDNRELISSVFQKDATLNGSTNFTFLRSVFPSGQLSEMLLTVAIASPTLVSSHLSSAGTSR